MKSCSFAAVFAVVSSVVLAGEPQSVLTQPVPAAEPAVAEPAVIVAAAPVCADGTCCTESSCRSSCRDGLFGRTVERTRKVTRTVVAVPVQVVTAPVRAVRGCRCCR